MELDRKSSNIDKVAFFEYELLTIWKVIKIMNLIFV